MRSPDLTKQQLQIVMHLANGNTLHEIAVLMSCSDSNVARHLGAARRKTNARTLPQLVSVVIADGKLEWTPDGRIVTS